MKTFQTHSEAETKKIAADLAKMVQQTHHSKVMALIGELGAGKTTFVQGFAKGLKIKDKITSPTFILIRPHKIPQSSRLLFHIDLYRLDQKISIKHLGIEEIINSDNIVLIEWAEKLKDLPAGTINITIEKRGLDQRIITLS